MPADELLFPSSVHEQRGPRGTRRWRDKQTDGHTHMSYEASTRGISGPPLGN